MSELEDLEDAPNNNARPSSSHIPSSRNELITDFPIRPKTSPSRNEGAAEYQQEERSEDVDQNVTKRKKKRRTRRHLFDEDQEEEIMEAEQVENPTIRDVHQQEGITEQTNEPEKDQPVEEQEELITKKLIEKDVTQQEERIVERKFPVVIKKEEVKQKQHEYLAHISELRPVVEGVIKQIQIRIKELGKLQEFYTSKQKSKEGEECKALSEKLRKTTEKLAQEYSSKYRYFDPQEEGIFADKKPFLLEKGQHLLEHRLLRESDGLNKFFDENGQLMVQMDPTTKVFTKPGENDFDFIENRTIPLKRTVPTRSIRSTTVTKHFKIEIDVREVMFGDHPLMSEEEIITRKIQEAFYRYNELKESDMYTYYQKRVLALQTELDRLRGKKEKAAKKTNPLDDLSYLTKEIKELEREMSVIRSEIRQNRHEMENEEQREIMLVNSMISNWEHICKVRANNRYNVTNLKMGFRSTPQNKEDDCFRIQYQIEKELQEIEEDDRWAYVQKLIEFREQLISTQEQEFSSLFLLSKKEPPVMETFKKEAERKKIIDRIGNTSRYPGEPIVIPEILRTEITKESDLPPLEIERRKQISLLSYHINVLINGNYVCKTTTQQLRSDFTINFNEIVSISVFKWPESISLQISQSGWFEKPITNVFVPIPGLERSGKTDTDSLKQITFTSPEPHVPVWELQASGSFPPSVFQFLRRNLSPSHHSYGNVKLSISWVKPSEERSVEAPKAPVEKTKKNLPTARDLLNLKQITSWMETNNIDPNDPRNTGLLSMLNELDRDDLSSKGFYLAEQDEDLFFFEDFNNSSFQRRLHLLKLRDEVKGKVPLPMLSLNLDHIQPRNVKSYEERIIQSLSNEARLSSYVNQVRNYTNNVVMKKAKRLVKTNIEVSQYVREPPLPEFHHSIDAIIEVFDEYRPLNPKRVQKEIPPINEIHQCNILIQITRGYNFPVRKGHDDETYRNYRQERLKNASELGLEMQMGTRLATNVPTNIYDHTSLQKGTHAIDTINYITMAKNNQEQGMPDRLLSFVAVNFDGDIHRTKSVEGPFPQFNQTLSIPLKTLNDDYGPEALKLIDKEIYFDVFDEITVEGLKDERDYNTINQRAEFKWLGSYSLPFSTLYQNGKIIGTFRLKTPPLYLGYGKSVSDQNAYSAITVCITLDPPLPRPEKVEDFIITGEGPEVYSYCQWWTKVVRKSKHAKNRNVKCLVPNIEGKATLLTRYITPQDPPPELQTASELARFVSLVPLLNDSLAFDAGDIWIGSQEFLDTRAGDWEEHSILLCNYFLSLGKTTFFVLGKGVPEGDTAYVLTVETNATITHTNNHSYQENRKCLWLWNSVTGEKYSIDDPLCPLQEIHLIASQTNIWINVQKNAQPSMMKFDLNDVSQFYPLYNPTRDANRMIAKECNDAKGKIQYKKLLYNKCSPNNSTRLEQDIRRAIEEGFSLWRHKATLWDNSVSKTFKELLQSFEASKKLDQALSDENQQQVMAIVNESSAVNGFPLNFCFKDIDEIVTEVRNTMVYDTYEPDVKFALAVYVEPYANDICSVWVYVASIINKRGYY